MAAPLPPAPGAAAAAWAGPARPPAAPDAAPSAVEVPLLLSFGECVPPARRGGGAPSRARSSSALHRSSCRSARCLRSCASSAASHASLRGAASTTRGVRTGRHRGEAGENGRTSVWRGGPGLGSDGGSPPPPPSPLTSPCLHLSQQPCPTLRCVRSLRRGARRTCARPARGAAPRASPPQGTRSRLRVRLRARREPRCAGADATSGLRARGRPAPRHRRRHHRRRRFPPTRAGSPPHCRRRRRGACRQTACWPAPLRRLGTQ